MKDSSRIEDGSVLMWGSVDLGSYWMLELKEEFTIERSRSLKRDDQPIRRGRKFYNFVNILKVARSKEEMCLPLVLV